MSERLKKIRKNLAELRQNILDGNINCIPLPYTRFREELPGIKRGMYYLISGATKSSKTQLTNYLFVFNSIYYYIDHKDQVKPTIHIFPLEETEEEITLRFYANVINKITKGKYCLSPEELESTDERKPLPQEVLDIMDSDVFLDFVKVYDECVHFHNDRNATGIYKVMKNYLESNGTIEYEEREITYTDEFGEVIKDKVKKAIGYLPNNPNEYVMFIVDHVGLLSPEVNNGRMQTLKDAIEKLSEYCVILRNKYKAIPVLVQQQNSETTNLDAFKSNKIRPTKDGLKDSKRTGEDASCLIGITNPYSFELPEYLGYDVRTMKSTFRVMEVVLNRKGKAGGLCPLYFNGACADYFELPLPTSTDIQGVYNFVRAKTQKVFMLVNEKSEIKQLKNTKKWVTFAPSFEKFKNLFKLLNHGRTSY